MKTLVRTGGLYRCCIQTIEELPDVGVSEGKKMFCHYCGTAMLYTKSEYETSAWQWDEPERKKEHASH